VLLVLVSGGCANDRRCAIGAILNLDQAVESDWTQWGYDGRRSLCVFRDEIERGGRGVDDGGVLVMPISTVISEEMTSD